MEMVKQVRHMYLMTGMMTHGMMMAKGLLGGELMIYHNFPHQLILRILMQSLAQFQMGWIMIGIAMILQI